MEGKLATKGTSASAKGLRRDRKTAKFLILHSKLACLSAPLPPSLRPFALSARVLSSMLGAGGWVHLNGNLGSICGTPLGFGHFGDR